MNKKTRKNIAIVSGDGSEGAFAVSLKKTGNRIISIKAISIKKLKLGVSGIAAFKNIGQYNWIFFSSKNTVEFFSKELQKRHLKIPRSVSVAAVGSETARALKSAGIKTNFIPKKFSMNDLVKEMGSKIKNSRILFPRSAIAPLDPIRKLRMKAAKVDVIHLYTVAEIKITQKSLEPIKKGKIDYIVFTSPSDVHSFIKNIRTKMTKAERTAVFRIPVACIGQFTASAVRFGGFKKIHTAPVSTAAGVGVLLSRLP